MQKELRYIKGVGPARERMLRRLGLTTVEEILFYFPRKYEDRTELVNVGDLQEKVPSLVLVRCAAVRKRLSFKTKTTVVEAVFSDDTGRINVSWFNQPYVINNIQKGVMYYLYASPRLYKGRMQFVSPEYSKAEDSDDNGGGIIPFYGLTAGLKQSALRKIIDTVLTEISEQISEFIPVKILEDNNLMNREQALREIHFPSSHELLSRARSRFIFEEFFVMQMIVYLRRARFKTGVREGIDVDISVRDKVLKNFGYTLTEAQSEVLDTILAELSSGQRMSRLLQGDVGSGKTVVAITAAFCVAGAGYQAVCMAPTEVLAKQHLATIEKLSKGLGIKSAYLGSSATAAEKRKVSAGLKDGSVNIVTGTQALLTDDVEFKNLRFAIIDEQHRFGVCQRGLLCSKGKNVDLLVMSATPIPRTLAMTMYGDLDVSYIKEYPDGRKFPRSAVVPERYRERVYRVLDNKIDQGRQAYIIYALVEDSEEMDIASAVTMHEEIAERFKDKKVGLLHGKLKPKEKDRILEYFRQKKYDILVSTLVVEVGVDVPNATLMVVENPERFGLAQLHQLRGRIMRSEHESYFYMVTGAKISQASKQRLKVIEGSYDGFEIAEADLKLRGPGDLFGIIQSGRIENRIADVTRDFRILQDARRCAAGLIKYDPQLEKPEHAELSSVLKERVHDVS